MNLIIIPWSRDSPPFRFKRHTAHAHNGASPPIGSNTQWVYILKYTCMGFISCITLLFWRYVYFTRRQVLS